MNPKLSKSEILFGAIMLTGVVLWLYAVLSSIIYGIGGDSVFFLLLGGQLFKIGFAYGDAKDDAEWRTTLVDMLAKILLRK